jgi:DNA-binding IscR family transcriptional regulator
MPVAYPGVGGQEETRVATAAGARLARFRMAHRQRVRGYDVSPHNKLEWCYGFATKRRRPSRPAAVLERFVSSAPGPLDLKGIAGGLEVSESDARKICLQLQKAGLICRSGGRNEWTLAVDRKGITLEDVWRSLSAGNGQDNRDAGCHSPEVKLLVSQALMAMQQHISRLLRQFQLDTVSVSRSNRSTKPNYHLPRSRSYFMDEN